jgi:hypothetical protein
MRFYHAQAGNPAGAPRWHWDRLTTVVVSADPIPFGDDPVGHAPAFHVKLAVFVQLYGACSYIPFAGNFLVDGQRWWRCEGDSKCDH